MSLLLVKDGLLVVRDGLLVTVPSSPVVDCECCVPSSPCCESYPLKWSASIFFIDKQGGSVNFPACVPTGDLSRVVCSVGPNYGVAREDFTPSNGSHTLELWSSSGGVCQWRKQSLPWNDYNFNLCNIVHRAGTATINVSVSGCVTGPGNVTVSCGYSMNTPFTSTVTLWSKIVTLGTGQKLKDYGSINMNPALDTATNGHDMDINGTCTGFVLPYTFRPTLTLTPSG